MISAPQQIFSQNMTQNYWFALIFSNKGPGGGARAPTAPSAPPGYGASSVYVKND